MPCIDGEGKPVIKESPYSDEQGLSAEGAYRCALRSWSAALLSQSSLRDASCPGCGSQSLLRCDACILLAAAPTAPPSLPQLAAVVASCSQRESLYEWMVGKMIFTAKKPFWLSVVRVPLYFWTMRFVTLTA